MNTKQRERQEEIDRQAERQRERLRKRPAPLAKPTPECAVNGKHQYGTAYKSSSGRKVCIHCGFVTEAPFENALGIGESGRRKVR